VIIFDQVTKTFPNGDTVLEDVNFFVAPGEFLVITGPSGAGKTTIGRLLIRELLPTSGSIKVDQENLSQIKDKHLPSLRRKIGTVFQDYKIIDDKTVYENIALALQIASYAEDQMADKISSLLEQMGIPNKGELFPRQLSGGELQRASLARAVASEPHILFADEPTGNLDKKTSEEIYKLLKKINQAGTTVIMATHDEDLINSGKHHRICLDKGKITSDQGGQSPDKFHSPDKPTSPEKDSKEDQSPKETDSKDTPPVSDIDVDIDAAVDAEEKKEEKTKKTKKKKKKDKKLDKKGDNKKKKRFGFI